MTVWSPQQNEALSKAGAWLRMRFKPWFYLAGYAGTGKTTLAMHLAEHADGKVAFAAFTGKAARVMRSKGCKGASTIHSLIYHTEIDPVTGEATIIKKSRTEMEEVCLIIIDECSMVNEEMGLDILSFGIPILVLGDPAQLPPVKGGGYFTEREPDYMLTEVHRQAADSPIIWLATQIRQGTWDRAQMNTEGMVITDRSGLDPLAVREADIVLVGKNDTRRKFNARLREIFKKTNPMPMAGEPLICLRNDQFSKISNGEIFHVMRTRKQKASIRLWMKDMEDPRREISVKVLPQFFENDVEAAKLPYSKLKGTQQFAYGYAITVHKSQGSQWQNVCVFDEGRVFGKDSARFLYTAVTRASEQLTLVL